MSNLVLLGILISVLLVLIIAVLAILVLIRRPRPGDLAARSQTLVADAEVETYERPSSLVSEQIEEIARRKLAQYPDLADTVLDFGTMPDGTIDIWVNRRQYNDVNDIPDERIRKAIQEAVEDFNARAG